MKRVTQGGDISFNVADVRGLGDNYAFRFYTTDSCKYIVKVDGDAVEDIIRLEWDELKTLGDGVLCYYADNLEPDEEYSDATFNRTFGGTTQWYIVTSCSGGGGGSSEEISELSDKLDAEIERSTTVDNQLRDFISENTVEIHNLGNRLYSDTYTKTEVDQKIAEAELGGDLPESIVIDANYVHTDNNFTTAEKNKLDGIAAGAEVNVQADWTVTDSSSDAYIQHKPTIPQNTSDLTNDSNFVVDADYVHTDNNYTTVEKNNLADLSTRVTTVETTLTNTYRKNETYSKTEVDDLIDVSGDTVGVQSITQTTTSTESGGINVITSTLTNGTTTTFQIRNGLRGEKGDTGNVRVDGNGNVLVVNSLDEGGPDAALSAEMGKNLNLDVNGREETVGTFTNGAYTGLSSNPSVGSTFDTTFDTGYAYSSNFKSCKVQVHAGDVIHVTAKGNGYHGGVAITDDHDVITYASGKNTKVDQDFTIGQNGWLYVTNANSQGTPVVKVYGVDGHEQRIDALEESMALIEPSVLDNQINGHIESGSFSEGLYWGNVGAVGTKAPTNRSSQSGYSCIKLQVKKGDKVDVYAKMNDYHPTMFITDKDNVITYKTNAGVLVNEIVDIEQDGYIYVNNVNNNIAEKVCNIRVIGNKLAINALNRQLNFAELMEGGSFFVPATAGCYPIINQSVTPSFFDVRSGAASSKWLALPKGIYNVESTRACAIYQSDKVLFHCDKAVNGTDVSTTSITADVSKRITIDKNYVLFAIAGGSGEIDQSVKLTLLSKTSCAAVEAALCPHVSFRNNEFRLYTPLRDVYRVVLLQKQSAFSNFYPHFGVSGMYISDKDFAPYPATNIAIGSSEYECAINLVSDTHNGYIGGHMHGYEKIIDADTQVYINGVDRTSETEWFEDVTGIFELSTHTQLFETDMETVIADVYKRWRIDAEGNFHLYNRVVFRKAVHINKAQFSMFGVLRKVGDEYLTCYATRNSSTKVYSTIDGWDYESNNFTDGWEILTEPAKATLQEQWGDMGYIVTQQLLENNQRENGGMFINSNGGRSYNKMYFEIGSNFDVSVGEELFSHAILGIK